MHTVHLASEVKNDVKYAAMGIFFSVEDYHTEGITAEHVEVIDRFFDSLEWERNNPKVAEVPYGDLMMMVDMDNRWVYKGSVTTPPCDTFVYWNVLQRVYPIKQKHLELFKQQLKRGDLEELGNYRMI
jgi:carbonic anhydrase